MPSSSSNNNSSTTRSSRSSNSNNCNHLHHLHQNHTHHIFATDKTMPSKTKMMGTQISSTEINIAAPVSFFYVLLLLCCVCVFSLLFSVAFFVSFLDFLSLDLARCLFVCELLPYWLAQFSIDIESYCVLVRKRSSVLANDMTLGRRRRRREDIIGHARTLRFR